MKKALAWTLSLSTSGALLLALAWLVDWRTSARLLSWQRAPALTTGAFFFALTLALRGARFAHLFRQAQLAQPLSVGDGFALGALNNLGNHLLPLRLGEALFVFLAKVAYARPVEQGVCVLVVARLGDLTGLLLVLTVASLSLRERIPWSVSGVCALAFFTLFALSMRLDRSLRIVGSAIHWALGRFGEGIFVRRAQRFLVKLAQAGAIMHSGRLVLVNLAFSLAIWASLLLCFSWLLTAFGLSQPWPVVALGSSGALLLPMLPLNAVGTLGTLEAGWTAGFVALGMRSSDAAASSLLVHGVVVLVSILAAFAGFVQVGPASIKGFGAWRQHDGQA